MRDVRKRAPPGETDRAAIAVSSRQAGTSMATRQMMKQDLRCCRCLSLADSFCSWERLLADLAPQLRRWVRVPWGEIHESSTHQLWQVRSVPAVISRNKRPFYTTCMKTKSLVLQSSLCIKYPVVHYQIHWLLQLPIPSK